MNPHYNIIIPAYNHLDLTVQCLNSIVRNSNMASLEIIFVNDGSTDGTKEWLKSLEGKFNISVIDHQQRVGFTKSCLEGMKLAKGDYIVLLNNDTLVTPNWLQHLENSLLEARRRYKNANFHLVGPMSNNVPGLQQIKIDMPIEKVDDYGEKYYSLNKNKIKPVLFLSGFCLIFSRKLYERVGEFDERFSPGGYEDRDFCLRARFEDFLACISQHTFIYHHGHKTIDEFPELDRGHINRWKYFEKWKDNNLKKLVAAYYVENIDYLKSSLKSIHEAVDEIVILDSSHLALSITSEFPKVIICKDTKLGVSRDRAKPLAELFKLVQSRDPDWILMMGEGYLMDKEFTREYAEKLMNPTIPDITAYQFNILPYWENLNIPEVKTTPMMWRNLPHSFDLALPHPEDSVKRLPLKIDYLLAELPPNATFIPAKETSIALVTIMKNEAKHLDEFLESIYLAFNEIILLDTGSSDNSKEIAQKWGAKVYDFNWNDHFGAARNAAINFANTSFILQLDIDERIEDITKIYEMINSGKDAFLFTIADLHPGGGVSFPESLRLFRNFKEVAYSGMIHETVIESLFKIKNIQVDRATTKIVHYGRLKPDAENRKKYYRELAEKQLRKNRDDPLPYFHLALLERDAKHIEEALNYLQQAAQRGWNKPNIRLELANTHLQAAYVIYQTLKNIDPGHPYYNVIMVKLQTLSRFFPERGPAID